MNTGRRGFLKGLTGTALVPALDGCHVGGLASAAPVPNYFCTWCTQAGTITEQKESGESMFPGDQGIPGCRDNLDERTVFGKNGWARTQYPSVRGELNFLLDDGWDVDYGFNPYEHTHKFGSLILNERRFPSIKGTPAERLRELRRRLQDLGWHGLGLWVACQAPGESWSHWEPDAVWLEDLKRKLAWCGEADVGYLKVDWGARDWNIPYRVKMSELAKELCPNTLIEHALTWGIPLNGSCKVKKDGKETVEFANNGRSKGHEWFEGRFRKGATELMKCADAFRIYDLTAPIYNPTAIERTLLLLQMAEETGGHALINVEDVEYLGAALGCPLGVMRSRAVKDPNPLRIYSRCDEADRAVAWLRLAPAFGARKDYPTIASDELLTDTWTMRPGMTWCKPVQGLTVPQTTAAVVARGMKKLPEVTGWNGAKPYVVASRNPNGALSVAALPRLEDGKGYTVGHYDVYVPEDPRGVPVGVFGRFQSVAFDCPVRCRVLARDLLGGKPQDITAECAFLKGRVVIPGMVLTKIGGALGTDLSEPGALVEFA